MGDEKPSYFLQRVRSMVEKNVPDSVLKTIFLEKVPQSLYDVLVVNPDADLITLALLADRVMKFWSSHIASMSRSNMVTSAWQPKAEEYQRGDNMATSVSQPRAEGCHQEDNLAVGLSSTKRGQCDHTTPIGRNNSQNGGNGDEHI
ncbi:hypothetical protein K0M31_001068 [Melipona bicolor]|uniref:Uncharacterized protein n=1 Tax=Melipona bicolor TaxID=60889 RepID=A0AA40KXG4_9HYME|nr:hypothetical protein K0M31_001068 [Melipona bicolor]